MAGLEPDTSSYNQPLPVSPLDVAGKVGSLQQQKLAIDQAKLDQANQGLAYMVRAMGALGPNATKEQYIKAAEQATKMGLVPVQQLKVFTEKAAASPDSKSFFHEFMNSAATAQQQIEYYIGKNKDIQDQANIYSGVERSPAMGGGFAPTTQMAVQPPPTTPIVDESGRPGIVGAPPAGVRPAGRLPASPPSAAAGAPLPRPRPSLPVEQPSISGPIGPTANKGTEFNNRFNAAFPNAVATGPMPGTAGANQAVAEQSGKDYATDLSRAKNFQADIYPANRVLDILKAEGPKAFGVGTDNLNTFKNAIVTWFPNVDPKTIQSVANFEEAKKQLVALARSAGNTGTNDQLAAAFEANPNTKMTGATIENVLKSVIALRKMQHAQTLLFGQQGLQPSEYSQWISKNQNVLDPRAFGFDIMSNEAKTKLLETMATKDRNGNWVAKKGKEKDFKRFENSLSFANDAGLIEPPGRS